MIKKYFIFIFLFLVVLSGGWFFNLYRPIASGLMADTLRLDDQEATVRAINKVMPAVVSIIIIDQQTTVVVNLNTGERTEKKEKAQ